MNCVSSHTTLASSDSYELNVIYKSDVGDEGRIMRIPFRGDRVSLSTEYFYSEDAPGSTYDNVNMFVNEILLALAASGSGILRLSEGQLIDPASGGGGYTQALNSFLSSSFDTTDVSRPHAYLVWMLYDNNMRLLPHGSGARRVTDPNSLRQLLEDDIPIVENGYLHTYVSNGSAKGISFDNFLVKYARGKTRQINHYYPYGLTIAGIDGDYDDYLNKYTSKELQTGEFNPAVSTGLEMLDFGSRFYDPQIGRWHTPDPAEQFANPYLAMGNNPVNGIDPNGEFFLGTLITGFIESIKATLQTVWDFGEMVFSDHTWKEFNEEYRSNMRNLDPTKQGTRFNSAIRIDVGSFKGDFGQIMSRWTWELPQTLIGKGYGHLTNNIGRVESVGYFDGATVVNVTDLPLDGDKSRGVAFGSFIYGEGISDNPFATDRNGRLTAGAVLLRHEYGHYRQSQKNGWTYLPKYGIPSANGAGWTEIDAEYRSDRYFFTRYGSSPIFSSYSSDYRSINAKWWEHLLIFGGGYFTGGSIVSIFNLSNPK